MDFKVSGPVAVDVSAMGFHVKGPMILCGIDPGREKMGVALAEDGALLFSAILSLNQLPLLCAALGDGRWDAFVPTERREGFSEGKPEITFLGNGTASAFAAEELKKNGVDYCLIDESGTTLEARTLYWQLHPPQGLWSFFPLSLRVPPRPLDDLAAWAILKRGEIKLTLPE